MRTTRRTDTRVAYLVIAAWLLQPAPAVAADEPVAGPEAEDPVIVETRIPAVTRFPDYPPRARRDRIEGEATVCFKVAPNGRVLDPAVASSSHEIFEKPALEAIRASSFEPLAPDEAVSATRICRTFRFRLDPVETVDESETI